MEEDPVCRANLASPIDLHACASDARGAKAGLIRDAVAAAAAAATRVSRPGQRLRCCCCERRRHVRPALSTLNSHLQLKYLSGRKAGEPLVAKQQQDINRETGKSQQQHSSRTPTSKTLASVSETGYRESGSDHASNACILACACDKEIDLKQTASHSGRREETRGCSRERESCLPM